MMISGAAERESCFVDRLLVKPIAQKQKSYLKDTTDFITVIERTKLPNNTILVSMDVTSLYTNIVVKEGMTKYCMPSIRGFLPGRPTSPYKALERNALSHSTRLIEFIPVPLKEVPTNPTYKHMVQQWPQNLPWPVSASSWPK